MSDFLQQTVDGVSGLRGIFITTMPDCLLFASWIRDEEWVAEEVATYFGDLVRSNRSGLRALGSWSSDMQVTIESADALIVLTELSEHFVCATVFERELPLGMVRLHLKKLVARVQEHLPTIAAEEVPRGVRIIDFLKRYAPDSHAVLMRVSVRTGLAMAKLEEPATLEAAEIERLEESAKRILGLQQLSI